MNIIKFGFTIATSILIISCGSSAPEVDHWGFLNPNSFNPLQTKENTANKIVIMCPGEEDALDKKIKDKILELGYKPATSIDELMEYGNGISDEELFDAITSSKNNPLIKIKTDHNFVKNGEGLKYTVYKGWEGLELKVEKYKYNIETSIHTKAITKLKALIPGTYSLHKREFSNLDQFSGEDLAGYQAFQSVYTACTNKLMMYFNEDGTYKETFPMFDSKEEINGTWVINDDASKITLFPSGNKDELQDSYFIKNEPEEKKDITLNVTNIYKHFLEFKTTRIGGVVVSSSFQKY